jgi:hypothetical protein
MNIVIERTKGIKTKNIFKKIIKEINNWQILANMIEISIKFKKN